MADIDCGTIPHHVVELGVDFRLGNGIQSGGGLIQDYERRVLVERTGKGNLLGLAARDFHALFIEILVKGRLDSLGQGGQPLAEARFLQAADHLSGIVLLSHRYVLRQREGEETEILENHRENREVIAVAVLADVRAVEQNLSLGGVIETAEQLDKGGLA